jgi:dipeptidase
LLENYGAKIGASSDPQALIIEANQAFADLAQKETDKALNTILYTVSCQMKNGFNRSDN